MSSSAWLVAKPASGSIGPGDKSREGLIRTPQGTVRDWRRRGIGPQWARFNRCGRHHHRRRSPPVPQLRDPARHEEGASTAEPTLTVYLSLEQAAEVMSLSVRTIRRRIADGTIPAYQCGRRSVRIRLDNLEAALRCIPSTR